MQILLDPWVLDKAFSNEDCAKKLAILEQNKADFCFIITEKLKESYSVFLEHRVSRKNAQMAIVFARHLVNRTVFKHTFLIPNSLQSQSVDQDCNCQSGDLDHHLLEIIFDRCQMKTSDIVGPAIILLLDCPSCGGVRKLCLRSEECRQNLLARFRDNLEIVCAEDRKSSIKIRDPRNMMNDQQHDARFEDECASWLERRNNKNVDRGVKRWGHQIDVLLVKDSVVYVGECKLVHGGNAYESQEKALSQLEKRICDGSKAETGYQWKGLVFCNQAFDQQIINKAKDIEQRINAEFVFIKVDMPKDWKNKPDWRLSDNNFKQVAVR